ncbi:MAG TPA: hypothetical protein VIL55_07975 [Naasia sp.]
MAELRRYTKDTADDRRTADYRVEDDGKVNLPAASTTTRRTTAPPTS